MATKIQQPGISADGLWSAPLVKHFLNAKIWKFEKDPWPAWFALRGGPEGVLNFICSRSIPPQLQDLLEEILHHPAASRDYYADTLKLHPVTVSEYSTRLARLLATHLNQWIVEPSPPACASATLTRHPQPLSSLNLPSSLTSFIGREDDLATVQDLVRRPGVRLITLTGPGGVGKTRLALQVAERLQEEFPDGVCFVPLASTTNPQGVLAAIAQMLGLKASSEQEVQEVLKQQLQNKHLLLVLDNFEQVVAAGPLLADLLAAAGQVKIVVTSRAVLRIYGEQEYLVPPLALPDMVDVAPLETLTRFSALALFVERAYAVTTGFQLTEESVSAVVELCRRLDGLPLAIEIAAAHIKYFSPQAMLARLLDPLAQFVAPTRDRPARQQTLHATLAWSYDLLTADEQTLFTRLAVFRNGCTLEAAAAVCAGNGDFAVLAGLIALTDKSLLLQKQGQDGAPRFGMLETIHAYAQEQLAARGEQRICQHAHALYYLALVEQAEPKLIADQAVQWLDRLEQEHDNLRCALRWALEDQQWDLALRMSGALREFWYTRGYFREGREWLAQALQGSACVPEEVIAKAIYAESILAMAQGDFASAITCLEHARTIYQALGKQRDLARVFHSMGNVYMSLRDYDRASALYDRALRLFQSLNDPGGVGDTIHNLGMIAFYNHDYRTARLYLEEGLSNARTNNFAQGIAISLVALGSTAYWERNYPEAIRCYKESLALNQHLNDHDSLVLCLESLGFVAHDSDDFETAAHLFGATSTLRERLGLPLAVSSHDTQQQMIERGRTTHSAQWDAWWSAGQAMTTEQIIGYVHAHLHECR